MGAPSIGKVRAWNLSLSEIQEARDAQERHEVDILKSAMGTSDALADICERAFAPVHVVGGPCVDSAPSSEKFVHIGSDLITCKLCQVHIGLVEDVQVFSVQEPRKIALSLVVVHGVHEVSTGKNPFSAWRSGVYCGTTNYSRSTAIADEVTCPECRLRMPAKSLSKVRLVVK